MPRSIQAILGSLMAAVLVLAVAASPARADFGVAALDVQVERAPSDPLAGAQAYSQAGGHPHRISTEFRLNTHQHPLHGANWPEEPLRDVVAELPAGLLGNPQAAATCTLAELNMDPAVADFALCPPESQVGVVDVSVAFGDPVLPFPPITLTLPVFNMEPAVGSPARFGFNVAQVVVIADARLRGDGEYVIDLEVNGVSEGLALIANRLTFWGVPADDVHTPSRSCQGEQPPTAPSAPGPACESSVTEPVAFLRLPTSCVAQGEGLGFGLHADSWFNVGARQADGTADLSDPLWRSAFVETHDPPSLMTGESDPEQWGPARGTEGCDAVPVAAELDAQPTVEEADSPTGLDVTLEIANPGLDAPLGVSASDLRTVEVLLPEGVAINPSQANGLGACSPEQFESTELGDPASGCPASSKIGTGEVVTPLLEETLEGSLYVAEQDNNPFGSLLALYLVLENEERGILIELAGEIETDPATGQIKTTFDDLPELPFERMDLRFKQGQRAPLVTPSLCGTYETVATVTPHSDPANPIVSTSSFEITEGPDGAPCPASLAARPFGPSMSAGLTNPVAGWTSPFVLRLTRPDGHQELSSMEVTAPEGVSAFLKGIPVCSDAAANAGSCPAASKVGRALSGAGAGPAPFYVPQGSVFLTGPYKGAPLGMLVQVPAIAGPFDLGVVNVRAAVHVDRRTAQVRVVSDPLPQILQGIPLRIRDIRVVLDRDGFTVAPTDCSEKRVLATVHGSHGGVANLSNRFQVADCAALGFRPRLGLALKGRRQARTGGHPAVRAVVRQAPGQAAIRAARVALPKSLALDPDNAQALCEFADGTKPDLENHCPEGSIVGRARAVTPLLDRPLVGNVYFVKNVRIDPDTGNEIRTLPMIVTALRGQIDINLVGESSTTKSGRLVNTFAGVPDAPIRRFNLNIRGGRNGILAVTRTRRSTINLCTDGRQVANTGWRAHNGKLSRYRVRVKTPCRSAQRKRQLRLRRAAAKRRATARRNR